MRTFNSMKSIACMLAVIGCLCARPLLAQTSRFSANKYVDDKGDTLRYQLLYPDANKLRKYPLVIFLHGSGERGSDNEAQLKWGVMNFATDQNMALHPAIVVAPQCPEKMAWSNETRGKVAGELTLNAEPSKPMRQVIGLIRQLITTMPVDNQPHLYHRSFHGWLWHL